MEKVGVVLASRLMSVPQHLILLTDNTAREQKNQHVAMFLATLVAGGRFATVTNNFFRVGHTHMKLDQRFSVVASKLSAAPVLQTPAVFAAHIEQTVRSDRLTTCVEQNTGAWDWQAWLEPLGVKLSGLTPSAYEPDVCHCWRFVRRGDLHHYVSKDTEDRLVVPPDLAAEARSPDDCVFLVKQFVSSSALAQLPILILPASRLARLPRALLPAERNALSEEAKKNFTRAAHKLAAPPWNLHAARDYLLSWIDRNERKVPDSPGGVHFVLSGRTGPAALALGDQLEAPPPELRSFAPGLPRVVQVHGGAAAARNVRRRIAKAAPPTAAAAAVDDDDDENEPAPTGAVPPALGLAVGPAPAPPADVAPHVAVPPALADEPPAPAAEPAVVVAPPAAPRAGPPPARRVVVPPGGATAKVKAAAKAKAKSKATPKAGAAPPAPPFSAPAPAPAAPAAHPPAPKARVVRYVDFGPDGPPIGCPKCGRKPTGCTYCRARRQKWEHRQASAPDAGAPAAAVP